MAVRAAVTNHLIDGLSREDRNILLGAGEVVQLQFKQVLCEPREAFRYAFFPLTSFISLATTLHGHQPLEMNLIGSDGMLGATLQIAYTYISLPINLRSGGSWEPWLPRWSFQTCVARR